MLASCLLPTWGTKPLEGLVTYAQADWLGKGGAIFLVPTQVTSQKAWDDVFCGAQFEAFVASGSEGVKARLLACRTITSGCWLSALPSVSLGLQLGDAETRVSVGLRHTQTGLPLFWVTIVFVVAECPLMAFMAFRAAEVQVDTHGTRQLTIS